MRAGHGETAFARALGLTLELASSGRCQARGGRKGGLPVCEANGLKTKVVTIFAKFKGNTMADDDVPAKLKHFSAQAAIVPQSSALSHGFDLWGQQSCISSIADMSAAAGDWVLTPAAPAAGSIATDKAIRRAKMVRPMVMDRASSKNSSIPGPRVK